MDQFHHLRKQAERAERLARSGFDAVTTERLMSLSREFRERADKLTQAGSDNLN